MFGIRSIPTVALFKDGQPVDGFAGALPEGQLREFLGKHVEPAALIETPEEQAVAAEEPPSESAADAIARIQAQMAAKPDDESLKLDLALAQLRAGDIPAARAALDALPANLATDERAVRLRGQLELAHALDDAPDADTLRQRIDEDPGDWAARDLLGVRLVLGEAPAEGLEQFLHILQPPARLERGPGAPAPAGCLQGARRRGAGRRLPAAHGLGAVLTSTPTDRTRRHPGRTRADAQPCFKSGPSRRTSAGSDQMRQRVAVDTIV